MYYIEINTTTIQFLEKENLEIGSYCKIDFFKNNSFMMITTDLFKQCVFGLGELYIYGVFHLENFYEIEEEEGNHFLTLKSFSEMKKNNNLTEFFQKLEENKILLLESDYPVFRKSVEENYNDFLINHSNALKNNVYKIIKKMRDNPYYQIIININMQCEITRLACSKISLFQEFEFLDHEILNRIFQTHSSSLEKMNIENPYNDENETFIKHYVKLEDICKNENYYFSYYITNKEIMKTLDELQIKYLKNSNKETLQKILRHLINDYKRYQHDISKTFQHENSLI